MFLERKEGLCMCSGGGGGIINKEIKAITVFFYSLKHFYSTECYFPSDGRTFSSAGMVSVAPHKAWLSSAGWQQSIVIKGMVSKLTLSAFGAWVYHLLAIRPRVNYLICLHLSLLIFKITLIIITPISHASVSVKLIDIWKGLQTLWYIVSMYTLCVFIIAKFLFRGRWSDVPLRASSKHSFR